MALLHPSAEVLAKITSYDVIAAHFGIKDAPRNAMYEALGIDNDDAVYIIAMLDTVCSRRSSQTSPGRCKWAR